MIPKIIHNIWLDGYDTISNENKNNYMNIKNQNPEWEFIIWDNSMVEKLLQKYKHIYGVYKKNDTKTKNEIAKYVIMKEYGGLYFDIDYKCNSSLDSLFSENKDTNDNTDNAIYIASNESNVWNFLYPFQKTEYYSSFMGMNKSHLIWEKVFLQLKYADTSYKIANALNSALQENEMNKYNPKTQHFPIVKLNKIHDSYYQCANKETVCYKSNSSSEYTSSFLQYIFCYYKQIFLFLLAIGIIIGVEYLYMANFKIYGAVNFIPGMPGAPPVTSSSIQKKKKERR